MFSRGDFSMERLAAAQYAAMGRRIRQRRRELRLTQERLAERTEVSASFVGHLERGEKVPSVDTLARLAAALDVSLDFLVWGKKQQCAGQECMLLSDLASLLAAYGIEKRRNGEQK